MYNKGMTKKRFIIIVGIITVVVLLITTFTQKGYLYHKQLQIERIFKRISYFVQDQLASVIYSGEKIKIPIVFKKQEHALTCEIAALRMVLNYFGIEVTEDELLGKLTFDTKDPMTSNNIWGDPDEGFVGNIDGSIFLRTGYGVYEKPIRNLALNYRKTLVLEKANLSQVLEHIDNGHPVIVWGLLSNRKPIYWQTKEGKKITAFPGEHARIIIGFWGDISNPKKIILMDPIYGKIRMNIDKFLADWKTLDNRAVVVF